MSNFSSNFSWKEINYETLGLSYLPKATIEIMSKREEDKGEYRRFAVEIDSGACISVFNRSAGELILPCVENENVIELACAFGRKIKGYLHRVNLKIGSIFLEDTLVAFSESEKYPDVNLLGFNYVFTEVRVYFDDIFRQTYFWR